MYRSEERSEEEETLVTNVVNTSKASPSNPSHSGFASSHNEMIQQELSGLGECQDILDFPDFLYPFIDFKPRARPFGGPATQEEGYLSDDFEEVPSIAQGATPFLEEEIESQIDSRGNEFSCQWATNPNYDEEWTIWNNDNIAGSMWGKIFLFQFIPGVTLLLSFLFEKDYLVSFRHLKINIHSANYDISKDKNSPMIRNLIG